MATNGMQAAGYQYINVDGGWWNSTVSVKGQKEIYRNSSGFPSWDPAKYPKGQPSLIDYIHSKGFKYGHYTDAGTAACDHEGGMSEGYERQDASLFASWKIDMIKIDACATHASNSSIISRWKSELRATERPILFSNCHNGCGNDPFMSKTHPNSIGWAKWCANDTNMWRTSRDIEPKWNNIMFNLHTLVGLGVAWKTWILERPRLPRDGCSTHN